MGKKSGMRKYIYPPGAKIPSTEVSVTDTSDYAVLEDQLVSGFKQKAIHAVFRTSTQSSAHN